MYLVSKINHFWFLSIIHFISWYRNIRLSHFSISLSSLQVFVFPFSLSISFNSSLVSVCLSLYLTPFSPAVYLSIYLRLLPPPTCFSVSALFLLRPWAWFDWMNVFVFTVPSELIIKILN